MATRHHGRLVPDDRDQVLLELAGRRIKLTNLRKLFWPHLTKGQLLQYYVDVSPWLLPHLRDRAMVMKRYPDGAAGPFFFMKRAPAHRPEWIETVAITHASGSVIEFPMVQDLPSLLWLVNLGCIDLNPWYARADDVHRPDYLHFDLDPGTAPFAAVKRSAQLLDAVLRGLGMSTFVKTSGGKGLHVYVPLRRGPLQKQVWSLAKSIAVALAGHEPGLMTAVYERARRPPGRVLIDYNQNRWGATLASVYSVRPTPVASVSTPVTWEELPAVEVADFTLHNVPRRLARRGDLWAPLDAEADPRRYALEPADRPSGSR